MTAQNNLVLRAARLLDERIGLKPDVSFQPRLARALRDVADAMNIDREKLVSAIATDGRILDQLLDRVTVQETAFFRHPEQFETIAQALLPTFRAPFRAWSAACSNGQEAYSLAMLMGEAGVTGSVLASDISPAALRRTASGCYYEREMLGVSAERRRRHFVSTDDGWQAQQNLREMVTMQRHNLLDPIPPHVAACQVVMCRNVLIYFTQRHTELFLERLAEAMDPTAYLFVGAAEMLWQMTDRFEPAQIGACYVYRPCLRRSGLRARARSGEPPKLAVTQPHAASSLTPRLVVTTATTGTRPARRVPNSGESARAADHTAHPIGEAVHDDGRLARELLASGTLEQAIVAFRQWTYLSPDDPAAHFELGSALDAAGATTSALRAYRAAVAALDRCDPEKLVSFLQGHDRSDLRRLLTDRCRVTALQLDAASPGTPLAKPETPTANS